MRFSEASGDGTKDCHMAGLRSASWDVEGCSTVEDSACFLVHEHRECVALVVIEDCLDPSSKCLWPLVSMYLEHLRVPGFLEPWPVVPLGSRETGVDA